MIDTPNVDWFALSPSLTALGAAAICLLSGAFVPRWILRPFAAFFCALGFIGGGVFALLVYIETPRGSLEVADATAASSDVSGPTSASIFEFSNSLAIRPALTGSALVSNVANDSERPVRTRNISAATTAPS